MHNAPSIMISRSYFSILPPPTSLALTVSHVFKDPQPPCWSQGWVQRCVYQSYRRCACQSGRCVCGCSPSAWRGTETPWQQQDTPALTGSWLSHTSKRTFMWKWMEVRVVHRSQCKNMSCTNSYILAFTQQSHRLTLFYIIATFFYNIH